jgi:transposase
VPDILVDAHAVEGAGGLGHLLSQQLAARVRLLGAGAVNKNNPNDARSVAIAVLRSRTRQGVRPDDHATVLKVWAKRYRDLGRGRTQTACRLHAALCELVPGGIGKEITAAHAARVLEQVTTSDAVQQARWELAADLLDDLRRADARLGGTKKKLAAAVQAAGTTLTEIFGAGPVIAAAVIGEAGDIGRFAGRDRFAACNGTAPIEVSSGKRTVHRLSRRGNRRLNHAAHMAAVTQVRYPHSDGRACYDKKLAEGKTAEEALRALKRQVSDAFYKHLKADAARAAGAGSPGGQPGNDSVASAAGLHPEHRLFGQATPGPAPTLRPAPCEDHARTPAGPSAARRGGAGPGLPALPAPRGRRGSGVKVGRQAAAAGNAA